MTLWLMMPSSKKHMTFMVFSITPFSLMVLPHACDGIEDTSIQVKGHLHLYVIIEWETRQHCGQM